MKQLPRNVCRNRASRLLPLTLLLYLGFSINLSVSGQTIVVSPRDGRADQPLAIRVSGLKPHQPVVVRASAQDAEGKLWQSYAGFLADESGAVDLRGQAPANGTYAGADSMGLVWSMNLTGAEHDRARFAHKRAEPLSIRFSMQIEGREAASVEVVRSFLSPGTKITDVREGGLYGTLFMPAGAGSFPGVIVLGGSEGGLNSEDVAASLSAHGYAALALAYFGAEGLPSSLEEIPLEYFKRAIDWLARQPSVKGGGVALVGTSKGAEAALLVGAHYGEVRAVVGYVPSGVVWSCICSSPDKSSWSLGGRPVPFIPQDADPTYRPPQGFPVSPAINYAYRLRNRAALARATIPVERINGPVLLISAGDDQLWPSTTLAGIVMDRLRSHKRPFRDQHLAYKSAGHLIGKAYLPAGATTVAGGRLNTGGTPEANARAQADSWPKVLKFLEVTLRH